MISEDELRERLHVQASDVEPREDLLESLAKQHSRRYRRARIGLVGGSLVATGLVVALWTVLLTVSPSVQTTNGEDILERAKQAAAATDMIECIKQEDFNKLGNETWLLTSEQRYRHFTKDSFDVVIKPPDSNERIDYVNRTVEMRRQPHPLPLPLTITGGLYQPGRNFTTLDHIYGDETLTVRQTGDEVRLTSKYGDLWLDPETYLPTRATITGHRFGLKSGQITWVPATEENRRLLEHTVPPDFRRIS